VRPAARGGGHGEPVARVVPLGRRDLGLRDAVDRRRRVAPVGRGFVAAAAVIEWAERVTGGLLVV